MTKAFIAITLSLTMLFASPIASAQTALDDVGSYTEDARSARIAKLKETYKISLTDKEKELVASRCGEAQKNLLQIKNRLNTTRENRQETYTRAVLALKSLKTRFDVAQIDASNLDLLIVAYQQKNTAFQLIAADYDTAITDLVTMNCVADPVGFRAALEGVRSTRKDIVRASGDLIELTHSSLPTTFDSLKLRISTSNGAVNE